jgi:hypothetical protein
MGMDQSAFVSKEGDWVPQTLINDNSIVCELWVWGGQFRFRIWCKWSSVIMFQHASPWVDRLWDSWLVERNTELWPESGLLLMDDM